MNNKDTLKYNKFFLLLLVILNTLVCLVRIENSFYRTTGSFSYLQHTYYSSQINVELIVSGVPEYNLRLYRLYTYPDPVSSFFPPDFNSISNLLYNNYVIVQLKSLKQTFIHDKFLITILHKSNIWHKSSDDDPLPIS